VRRRRSQIAPKSPGDGETEGETARDNGEEERWSTVPESDREVERRSRTVRRRRSRIAPKSLGDGETEGETARDNGRGERVRVSDEAGPEERGDGIFVYPIAVPNRAWDIIVSCPCRPSVPGARTRHDTTCRAVPARARHQPCRAVPRHYGSCRASGRPD
jgi:hypothetical protein